MNLNACEYCYDAPRQTKHLSMSHSGSWYKQVMVGVMHVCRDCSHILEAEAKQNRRTFNLDNYQLD